MGRIDCSLVVNFASEWERRKKWYEENRVGQDELGFRGYDSADDYIRDCGLSKSDMDEAVSALQQWSDEHPRETRKEKFERIVKENGMEYVLKECKVSRDTCANCAICFGDMSCGECKKYWSEVVDQ